MRRYILFNTKWYLASLVLFSIALFLLFSTSTHPSPLSITQGVEEFLHITDIHIDAKYIEGSSPSHYCHAKALKRGGAGSPIHLVNATYSFIASELAPTLDFIIDTGDAVRHNRDKTRPEGSDAGLADHARVASFYASHLDLDRIQVIPTIGNNDEFAHDTTVPHSPLLERLTDIWSIYRLNLKRDMGFSKGGPIVEYARLKNPKLEDCNKRGLGQDQMRWLEGRLDDARSRGTRIYIVGHIPPNKKNGKRAYSKHCYRQFLNLLGDYSDVIDGSFHGHTNADTLSLLVRGSRRKHKKKRESGPRYELITLVKGPQPALTSTFELVAVLTNGPSIVPLFAGPRGALLGYTQLYADLLKANRENQLRFEVEYTTRGTYGLPDLSITSWKEFIQRLLNPATRLYSLYSKFVTVSSNPKAGGLTPERQFDSIIDDSEASDDTPPINL
ncbi:hypothetical protein L0F63_007145 [Massospora cicadina]|nr:hypothetical protein L0F63_007145 [Massospora cicadina]